MSRGIEGNIVNFNWIDWIKEKGIFEKIY